MRLPRRRPATEASPAPVPHPLMQATLNTDYAVWVATDHAVWATFKDPRDAIELAEKIAEVEVHGERVLVTCYSTCIYSTRGRNQTARQALVR